MKKVVILKSCLFQGGGLEKYALRLANGFVEKGCRVVILTTGRADIPCCVGDIEVVNLFCPTGVSFYNIVKFNQCCRDWLVANPADVIFGMDRNEHQTHYRAGGGVHVEYLRRRIELESWWKGLSFRVNPLHRKVLELEKRAFEDPLLEVLFTNSNMVRKEVLHHFDIIPGKVRVVHNGVEWHEMANNFAEKVEDKSEIRESLGLDPLAYQFLFVGNGYHRKGLSFLLEGMAKLGRVNECQLSVVGKDKNKSHFIGMAEKLGVKDRVKFFGSCSDVMPFYQMADSLVIPSFYDPFANVTVEALAMGLFVISSKYNGGSEVLTDSSGVTIMDMFDVGEMVVALEKAMESSTKASDIRNGVEYLDFRNQLGKIIDCVLGKGD